MQWSGLLLQMRQPIYSRMVTRKGFERSQVWPISTYYTSIHLEILK